jgi:hypothetical protein
MISLLSTRPILVLASALTTGLLLAGELHANSPAEGLSKDTIKKTCRAEAERQGMETGDFGDVKYMKAKGFWEAKLNVRGSGDKFKANCQWNGSGEPKFVVAGSGANIVSKKYSKKDVNKHCREEALSRGMEVGDFGDTDWNKQQQHWVAKLKVQKNGEKRKTSCTWDGHQRPVIH